jgi:hypothetical protein
MPPSQVSSLASGTPTSTTIPVTYTAATGMAPITYAGYTSPHGAGTWTLNAGTFSATGGTFTALSSGTNYDLQITATNSVGSSTTVLSSVSTAAATVAPSQVANLAAGASTTSTIAVTYTAATGTPPITYAGYTSPHGAGTWTLNAGTFSATGGTLTGLSAGTNYDLQITATNSAGSSTTSLTTGVTTAAAAAIAPSQVGSLTAVMPTAFTIPVTYTAPSGTAPIIYVGFTSPHGANNWTQNTGSFNASGGVFFGLSPSTNYDLRIVASNSAGSSTTNLLTGTSTSAAPSFTGAANRYDIVMGASVAAPGGSVTGSLYPNGTWGGQTITLAAVSGSGTFSPATVATTSGSSTPVSFSYVPIVPGEHAIGTTNSGSLYNPYSAPLNVFAASAGSAQTLVVSVAPATSGAAPLDPQPRQYDTLATLAQGFSFTGAKGYGSVALNVAAIGGATTGLFAKLYDANSAGATTTAGTGTALQSTAVQVYGAISAAGTIHIMLPASLYYYYLDIATDAVFTNPVRVPQRIVVGLGIGLLGRSQEAGVAQWYYDNSTPTGETWTNTLVRYGPDYRYEPNYVGYYRQTGAAQTASHTDGSDPNGPSGGAQAAGRIIAAEMGVNVFMIGIAATGGGVDEFINHDGSLSLAATFTFNDAGIDGKFRWLWAASLDGWDNVNSAYPGTFAEYQTRYIAAMDWVARTYPACAVQGWGGGGTGRPESDGSAAIVAGVTDNPGPGAARLQSIFLNQVEPVNPMVVSKENYAWAAFCGSHGDTGSRRIYVQTGIRQLLSAELAINGGLQTQNRGPVLLTTGTASQSARVVRIYGKFNGGGGLQTVQITQLKPNYTVTFGQATASQLCDLFAVYGPGGYSGNGLAIKITGVAINYSNLPTGADFSLDATLAGTTGVTYSDGSTSAFPTGLAVQYAADLQASGGNGYVVWDTTASPPPTSQVTMICDTQVSSPWEWGRHIRPQLDIAITVGS